MNWHDVRTSIRSPWVMAGVVFYLVVNALFLPHHASRGGVSFVGEAVARLLGKPMAATQPRVYYFDIAQVNGHWSVRDSSMNATGPIAASVAVLRIIRNHGVWSPTIRDEDRTVRMSPWSAGQTLTDADRLAIVTAIDRAEPGLFEVGELSTAASGGSIRRSIRPWLLLNDLSVLAMIVIGVLSLGWVVDRRRQRLRDAGLCPWCQYNLQGTPGHCPECGRYSQE